MRKIVFCFPYRGVGGVSLLFLRVAEEMASRDLAETWLVDYTDGFMALNRQEGLCKFLEYRDKGEVILPDNALIVFQSMTPWSVYPALRFAPKTRVLFWNCHPFNLVPTLPGFRLWMQRSPVFAQFVLNTLLRSYRQAARKLVENLLAGNSLVFMDRANIRTTERYLGLSISEPALLPIAAALSPQCVGKKVPNFRARGLRVAWIGRLVDFKYHILRYTLLELNRVQPELEFPIHVTIVGSGDYEEYLKADTESCGRLSTCLIDHIPPDKIDGFLEREVDLLMAMGTSALEGAKLGIPTILLDMSYDKVPSGYLFQWLHNRREFSLADVIGPEHIVPNNRSLIERIREIESDYSRVSERVKSYFDGCHSVSAVAVSLKRIAENATCTHDELERISFGKQGFLYSIFTLMRKRMASA